MGKRRYLKPKKPRSSDSLAAWQEYEKKIKQFIEEQKRKKELIEKLKREGL
jgi:hypothetical protein